jgi:membrane protease YdiL (CAAX protease family)
MTAKGFCNPLNRGDYLMKINVGSLDRFIRLLLASVLFYLGLFLYSGSTLGIGLVVAGGILLITALVGFCGFYRLLGIHTNQPNEQL